VRVDRPRDVVSAGKFRRRKSVIKSHNEVTDSIGSPVLVLAHRSWSENCRVGLAWQHQVLFALAELILRIAAVVAEVLLMNLSDDERVSWASVLHDVALGRVELHCLFKPNDLGERKMTTLILLSPLRFMWAEKCDDDGTLSSTCALLLLCRADKFFNTPFCLLLRSICSPFLNIKWLIIVPKRRRKASTENSHKSFSLLRKKLLLLLLVRLTKLWLRSLLFPAFHPHPNAPRAIVFITR
jgi:hypothetical protein